MEKTANRSEVAAAVDDSIEDEVRKQLRGILESRRDSKVPLIVRKNEAKQHFPLLQRETSLSGTQLDPSFEQPAVNKDLLVEHLVVSTEAGPQGQVPLLVIRPAATTQELHAGPAIRRPAIIFLHSTGRSKEMMLPHMQVYAQKGYVSLGVDSRYHGERAASNTAYQDALVEAWRSGLDMPFVLDTKLELPLQVWDLMKVLDYLTARPDVDASRIGITGVSLGGMHAWMATAADTRIAAAVPMIGVQSFKWAVENNRWQARVASIPHVFEAARQDLGKEQLDSETVAKVWRQIAPGLMDELDSGHTLPAISPRPLLILNGAEDPRCPVEGLTTSLRRTEEAYAQAGVPHHFKFVAFEGVGHSTTLEMEALAQDWFDQFLLNNQPGP